MWRPFFLAIGVTLLLLGFECMVIEKAVLAKEFAKTSKSPTLDPYFVDPLLDVPPVRKQREITPPEWAPWSLLSGGAIVVLYAIAMRPKKQGEESS